MKFNVQSKTDQILTVMKFIAWIAFIGFAVQTGATVISYVVSWFNPEAARNLYNGMNLGELRELSFVKYTLLIICWVTLLILKANVWYRVARIISLIKIENPFNLEIAHKLEKISYLLFSIWILGYLGSAYAGWLEKMASPLLKEWNSGQFLFMAGLMFIVSQIFKRGVELQSENDLTV